MSRRISTAPGKAFLWLIAIAVAALIEGALLTSAAWLPNGAYAMQHAPEAQEIEVEPQVELSTTRIVYFANMVVEMIRSAR